MNCPNCQTENPEPAKFCMNCGTPFVLRCATCQTELPPQAKFCMNCGTRVATAVLPPPPAQPPTHLGGERRAVTIMFADISGFTAMSERLDPEQVRNLMNRCFDHLVPIVEKYEGTVDKFIGDEIMALFGAPIAHEDDPARALRVGLEMQEALRQFNAQYGTDLGMHAGINTGLVIAGGIGSQGRRDYSVMGDAVNLAARLEDASERGEIFVGPDTYRLAAPLFEFEALEPIALKGKAEPVQIYKLLRAKDQPGRVRGLAGLVSPMVGRDKELQTLLELSEATQSGSGRIAIIIGEPGLGKSRLLAEWQSALASRPSPLPFKWATGQCLSYGQGLAYHLLIDTLRSVIGVPTAAEEPETHAALKTLTHTLLGEEMMTVYPYLGHLLSLKLEGEALEQVRILDPQALQNQYLGATRRLLTAVSHQSPLAIVLEDIHWADPSSTDLLIKLLPLATEAPILYCCLTRPEFDVPGWRLVTAVREQTNIPAAELALHTLSDDDSRQLITNLLEIDELPEHIRAVILRKAEGNPFFVEEVIRMLIDREAIVPENGRWLAQATIEQVDIPDNLQSLLLARIDRLPDQVKHTLRVASVIGRQFSVRVLAEVLQTV
ncbi:MAG: AAA family ATPase [Ardenticatenaceae bacterium]|nr:AAA family ATPase [Ardenticatenaceae bacterium]